MIFAEALAQGMALLQVAGVDDPARDARRLLAFAAGIDPARISVVLPDEIPEASIRAFQSAVAQRAERRPVSQIIGSREFWGRAFIVTPDVLDPRPETEHLIEAALEAPFGRVLDLGTGSGMILATLLAERPEASGLGADISLAALAVARRNLDRHAPRGELIESDWFEAVGGTFDLIVSNPPYIAAGEMAGLAPELAFEPQIALTDHADGLTVYRIIAAQAAKFLAPTGRVIVEIGTAQGPAVSEIFATAGWQTECRKDFAGHDRIVITSR